ncbi:MAG: UbiD family decarboxylase [Actinobacteria bacterium]|nr:UbiD family decarboxylase [Actinomycetota bacterium]
MPKDLGGFIRLLEDRYSDHIFHVQKEIEPEFGVTRIISSLEKEGQYPVVVFDKIKGSDIPLVINMHADFRRLALALDLDPDATIEEFTEVYGSREERPVAPVLCEDAPCHEVVITGDDVDLGILPILKYHERDAGRYVTGGYSIMKDPDSGVRNAGIYRLMVQGKDRLGIQISETAHGNYIMKKYRLRGETMEFAVSIGHHPAFNLGALSFTPFEVDEFEMAGAMMGEPLRVVRCRTVDAEVPADTEIVLECEMHPDEFSPEAPFGEYPGTYGPLRNNPVVRVKAITMRAKPIYQSMFVGHPDNLLLSGVTRNSQILRTVRIASPTVRAVNMPISGRCRFICYVAMKNLIEGDGKNVAMAAFAADSFLKYVIVVDDDVNIMKDAEVLHAIATRVRADHDVFMVTGSRGSPLDPASYDPGKGSHLVTKMGIDATRKANYPEEIRVPGVDSVDLSAYLVPSVQR